MGIGRYTNAPEKSFVFLGTMYILTAVQTLYNEQEKSEVVFAHIPKTTMVILWCFSLLLGIVFC